MYGAAADPSGDVLGQQVGQMAVDSRVRLAQDARQLRRVDERHPAEGVEQLSVGCNHNTSLAIEHPGGQPARGRAFEYNVGVEA